MAWITSVENLTEKLKKYRFAILIFIIGIVLMLLPDGRKKSEAPKPVAEAGTVQRVSINEELAHILSGIQGVGDAKVMLTVRNGEETLYQIDSELTDTSQTYTTVVITDSGKIETGLIRQVNPPTYLGAIVICQGGDDPAVKLAVTEAVADITGLGTDCISVLKMK